MPLDQVSGWPCVCGKSFAWERGIKIHRSKKDALVQFHMFSSTLWPRRQVSVRWSGWDPRRPTPQCHEHSLSFVLNQPSLPSKGSMGRELRSSSLLPPTRWHGKKQLDSELSIQLGNEMQKKPLEEKLDLLGEIVYSHCLSQLGGSEWKEVISPK